MKSLIKIHQLTGLTYYFLKILCLIQLETAITALLEYDDKSEAFYLRWAALLSMG